VKEDAMQLLRSGQFISRSVIGTLAALMFSASAFAVDIIDDPVQIDDQAAQVVQTSNMLCWEMHLYHQKQPNFASNYRSAKQIWTRAGELRDALRAGPVETEALKQQLNEMNATFTQLEATLAKWGEGDRSQVPNNSAPEQRTVVTQGTAVDLPLLGIHVGRPRVVVEEDDTPQLQRRRLHPNSPGSKRSLQRELAATKVALSDLTEDSNTVTPPNSDSSSPSPDAAAASKPVPEPPAPGKTENAKVVPASAKKPMSE
jgi:hypothetical protein